MKKKEEEEKERRRKETEERKEEEESQYYHLQGNSRIRHIFCIFANSDYVTGKTNI